MKMSKIKKVFGILMFAFILLGLSKIAYAEERSTININVSNVWNDNNNEHGERPEEVIVYLYADGIKVDSKTITADSNWNVTFSNLYEYEAGYEGNQDKKIDYRIDEKNIYDDTTNELLYSQTITKNGNNFEVSCNYLKVSNAITNEKGKILIPFTKKWVNMNENEMPDAITVKLYKYMDNLDTTALPIRVATVSKENNWTYYFDISDEEIYKEIYNNTTTEYKVYSYAVVEELSTGFYEIVSEHVDPKVNFTPPGVSEEWKRHEPNNSLSIQSNADFKTIVVAKTKGGTYTIWSVEPLTESERRLVFSTTANINGMSGAKYEKTTFISGTGSQNGLTVTDTAITFKVPSDWALVAVGLYNKSSSEANAASITNTKDVIEVKVSKNWDDMNNIEGLRPQSIKIHLFADGVEISPVEGIILSEENNWTYTFSNLNKFIRGELIKYTVTEENVDETVYQKIIPTNPSVTENGYEFVITNKHVVNTTTVKVSKEWENVDGINQLPGVKVVLKVCKANCDNNGIWTVISQKVLNEENNWTYTWDKDDNGIILPASFKYRVEEIGIDSTDTDEIKFFDEYFISKIEQIPGTNEWEITNTCTLTIELPETGNSGMLILVLMSISLMLGSFVYGFISLGQNGKGGHLEI